MENILDLLNEYSKNGIKYDKKYIKSIIKIMIKEKDLGDYIKKVSFKNVGVKNIPMSYNFFTKEISIYNNILDIFCDTITKADKFKTLSDFAQILLINCTVTRALLHEVEHANQYRKTTIKNEDFENLLLGICCYYHTEFLKESKLSQLLIIKKNIFLNKQLYHFLDLQRQIKIKYNSSIPTERMANIYSAKEISAILTHLSKNYDIENIISLFDFMLACDYLNGYSYNNEVVISPTDSYLDDIKKLNIYGLNTQFNENFDIIKKKAQNDSLERRLLLGLSISKQEFQKQYTLKKI